MPIFIAHPTEGDVARHLPWVAYVPDPLDGEDLRPLLECWLRERDVKSWSITSVLGQCVVATHEWRVSLSSEGLAHALVQRFDGKVMPRESEPELLFQTTAHCPREPDNRIDTLRTEDGGQALIFEPAFATAEDMEASRYLPHSQGTGVFVRVHSWDVRGSHEQFSRMRGRRVRVTVEVLDD